MRLVSILVLFFAVSVRADTQPFALEDVFLLNWASQPRVSPDGSFVVYTHNFMDIMADRRRSNLWRVDADGRNNRPLTTGAVNDSGAAISPGSTRLAYISSDDVGSQVFVRWLIGGETLQLTRLPHPVSNLAWSPDGQWLAFTTLVPEPTATMGELPAPPEGAQWAESPSVVERIQFRADGRGELPRGTTQVFVIPATGGAPRQVTSGEISFSGTPAWGKQSRYLYVSGIPLDRRISTPDDTEIYRVGLADGSQVAITDRRGPDDAVQVSPDGKQLLWQGYDDKGLSYQQPRLYLAGIDGSNRRELLADLDVAKQGPRWAADGKGLYFQFDEQGKTVLAHSNLRGRVTRIADDLGGVSLTRPYTGASFSVGGDRYAYTRGAAKNPAEIAVGKGTGEARQVTDFSRTLLETRALVDVEEIWTQSSHDGLDIQAWVAYPPNFDPEQRYPLLLEIHGGPHTAYGPHFAAEIQLFAAAGYVTVYANPRGSTSYGQAFAQTIHHNYPSEDYDDLMSVVDAVIEKGSIDKDRLYVTGGSGGGVLTAWTVGKTDRFRAAVVAKPVINWISFALSADDPGYFANYWFPAMPWEDPMGHWQRSPLSLVGNVTTPTMLLTGEEDWRTPMWESEQLYTALKLRGVDTALVRIPGASHSIARRPSQLMAKVAAILAWFEQHGGQDIGEP